MNFARTKIQPPRPPSAYVERGPVGARLSQALGMRRVVLVCAPAGYGKTSFLAHGVARLPPGHGLAWVSADAGDSLSSLLECLLAALEPLDPPWRTSPEALVQRVAGGVDGERAVAAELINTLDAVDVRHGVAVIDDLHRVEDPAFFRFLDRLVERMGERWTLALASRTEPPLALARLRAAGEISEFRQLHLQFARDEARRLVTAAGFDTALADRVFDRTQGWPAGLRMAVGAVEGGLGEWSSSLERALRSGERPMFDFLMAEVLDQLRPDLAGFLERASFLAELEASRCAEVTGNANAAAMLDEIERLGLFVVALDSPVRTLRLHDLFREALQQRLERRDPALFAQTRRRAVATEPDAGRRIALLVDAGEAEEAARLAMEHLPTVIVKSGPAGPAQVLDRFPSPLRERSPSIPFVRGLLAWVHWDYAAAHDAFAHAEGGFAAAGDRDREQLLRAYHATMLISLGRMAEAERALDSLARLELRRDARIMVLNARCWYLINTGRLRSVAGILSEMLDLLEAEARIDLWYHTSTPLRMPGLPGIAGPLMRHADLMLRAAGDEPILLRSLGVIVQAWCALWRGDLRESQALQHRAKEESDWSGSTGAVRSHMNTLAAFTQVVAGNGEAALEEAMTRVREQFGGAGVWNRHVLALFSARIAAASNHASLLREMLGEARAAAQALEAAGTPTHRPVERPLAAQLAWLEGRQDEAIAGWQASLREDEAIDYYGQAAETRVRLASALLDAGRKSEAAEALLPAFGQAVENGGPGGALLAGASLRHLAEASWSGTLAPESVAVLRAWCGLARSGDTSPDREGLTAREMQVLERIAAGESNKVIARALDLSLHTVKRHVANILGKLGVETRGQAAAWLAARKD